MTARPPRRSRRAVAASTLARPGRLAEPVHEEHAGTQRARRRDFHHRTHHVTTDYTYVKKDVAWIGVVTLLCLGFIVGMSFVL